MKNSWFPSAPLIAEGATPSKESRRSFQQRSRFFRRLLVHRGITHDAAAADIGRCSSNCGLISARITPFAVTKSIALGKIKVSEMNETSITQICTGSGTSACERNRAFSFS